MDRDFVGYAGQAPEVEWPGGARLAVSVVLNYEEGAERSLLYGDSVEEPFGEWGSFDLGPGVRNYINESFAEYGSRVGVWRLLDLLDRHDVKATIFACAVALEKNPLVARAIVERGHEVCSHGYRWEDHLAMGRDEDRVRVRRALDSLEGTTGTRPVGWFSRNGLTHQTRELLAEAGVFYDSNAYNEDVPYVIDAGGREHVVLPYSADTNDNRHWRPPGFVTPSAYFEYLKDTFDCLLAESERAPKMMSIGLHVRISGRPARSLALGRFLSYARSAPGVWFARRDEIARWWLDHRDVWARPPAEGVHG